MMMMVLEERIKHKSLGNFCASILSAGGIYSGLFTVLFVRGNKSGISTLGLYSSPINGVSQSDTEMDYQ